MVICLSDVLLILKVSACKNALMHFIAKCLALGWLCLKQNIKVSALTIEDGAQAVRFPHARVASEL